MKSKSKKGMLALAGKFFVIQLLVAVALLMAYTTEAATPALPKVVGFGTPATTTSTYACIVGLCKAITAGTGIQIRFRAAGATERVAMVVGGHYIGFGTVTTGGSLVHGGQADYKKQGWGPLPIRLFTQGPPVPNVMFVRGDSGIKTPYDLKGKRIADNVGNAVVQQNSYGYLAFGRLTPEDVTLVPVTSGKAYYAAVLEGQADATTGSNTASYAQELAASPHGIAYVQVPATDKDGWRRQQLACPGHSPVMMTTGAGVNAANPVPVAGYRDTLYVMASVDENLVYTMAKALYEGYDIYKDAHPKLKDWGVQSSLSVIGSDIPLHPGVVRYFKEIGKWTSEHEAWQQKALAEEMQMMEAFKAGTLVQADTALDIWKAAIAKY